MILCNYLGEFLEAMSAKSQYTRDKTWGPHFSQTFISKHHGLVND